MGRKTRRHIILFTRAYGLTTAIPGNDFFGEADCKSAWKWSNFFSDGLQIRRDVTPLRGDGRQTTEHTGNQTTETTHDNHNNISERIVERKWAKTLHTTPKHCISLIHNALDGYSVSNHTSSTLHHTSPLWKNPKASLCIFLTVC